jgi:hypothetical protein
MPKHNTKKTVAPRNKKPQDHRDGRLPKGAPVQPKTAVAALNTVKLGPQQGKTGEYITVEVVSGRIFDEDCLVLFEEIPGGAQTQARQTLLQGKKRLLVQVPDLSSAATDRFRVAVQYDSSTASDPNDTGADQFDFQTPDRFTVQRTTLGTPMVTQLDPDHGPCAGGGNVTITGQNFPVPPGVWFGNAQATVRNNPAPTPTSVSVVAPGQQAGMVVVGVTNPAHTIQPTPNQPWDLYTYANQPVVTGVSPASGPDTGNTAVTITGSNFTSVSAVYFGADLATNYVVANATTIHAQSPAEPAGDIDVRVVNPGGTSPINRPADLFTYS